MNRCFAAALVALALCLTGSTAFADARNACEQGLDDAIKLPADDAAHPYTPASMEWWYWVTHLRAEDGRLFGFVDIVYTALYSGAPDTTVPLQWSDTAVADISAGKYHFPGRAFGMSPAPVVANGFAFDIGDNHIVGGDGRDRIHATVDDGTKRYVVDLQLLAQKAPVEQMSGPYNFYYSRERMEARGTITIDGKVLRVRGDTWFDHQFGDQLVTLSTVQNWTWIAIQFDDDRELIVLDLNRQDGTKMQFANLTDKRCQTSHYGPGEFTLTPTGSWTASATCTYPMGWDLRIPAEHLALHVQPSILDQDLYVPGMDHYYEGDAVVTGFAKGPVRARAFVELTAFCPF
jgi:predicted secreted hydrolase